MEKSKYIAPGIRRRIALEPEQAILGGSVVDAFNDGGVQTTSQEVQSMDFSNESTFSHDWE